MVASVQHHPAPKDANARQVRRYVGRVVYMYAFDVAYDIAPTPSMLLGQPVAQFAVDASKRSPRQLMFYRPQMVRLPPQERIGPHGRIRVERAVKLLPAGAISITVSVPFVVESIEDLVRYHDLEFNNGELNQEVRQLAEEVRRELEPYASRPAPYLADEEAYTVFCLNAPLRTEENVEISTEDWFEAHRREVAALLTQESNIHQLSRQEADESTARYLSYYQNDLVVVDWDAALIIDEPANLDEALYVMELANFQLAELEAYDRILDEAMERSYRDTSGRARRANRTVLRQLRELRIDLARLSDELSNTTKFFGDWHLARVYEAITARFHLTDWHRTIDEKLKTLDNFYQILQDEHSGRWMLLLEAAIVLLFVIDLIMLFLLRGH